MTRRFRLSVFLLAAALLVPAAVAAQEAIITGTVRNQSLEPVRGASVLVRGLDMDLGTVTNDAGLYRIRVPNGAGRTVTLSVEVIGYRPTEVQVTLGSGMTRQDIELVEQAIALDEIVVTGTAGQQSRRAQAAVVSTVNADEITDVAPVSTVGQLLQSRLPGVSVQAAGGTMGGTQVIRMRGQASIALSNEPLVFIDGIRADQRTTQLYGVGGQEGSRLNDLNPEDIEDIEVIKGPAAAALYGADASAGVIHIITKKGRQNAGFRQTISAEMQTLSWDHFNPPDNWAACTQSAVDNEDNPLCYGQAVGTLVHDNPLERTNAIQDGSRQSLTWSGQGGGDNHSYYLSIGVDQGEGAFVNNTLNNLSTRGNFQFQPSPNLSIDMGMGVVRAETRFPRNDNDIYGWLGGAMLGSPTSLGTSREGWYAPNRQNEAIAAYENFNTNWRTTPRLQVNYSPFQWFTNRLTVGADMSRVEALFFFPKNDNGWYTGVLNTGQIGQARETYDRYTFEYMGNISNALTSSLSSDLSFGSQYLWTRRDVTNATGTGLTTNSANAINQAAQATGGQTFSEEKQLGFFGQWQVGYLNRLYVQLAGRLDTHSAFGIDADPFFSPKVGASYVISDEPFFQDVMPAAISALRLRAAFGTTGRSPTQGALATYTSSPYALTDGTVGSGVLSDDIGNTELRPERGTEIEAGFEAGLFDERIGLEFTYFNKVGTDVILRRPLPPSDGFIQNQLVNIGEVVNSGLELAVNARLLTTSTVGWDVRFGMNTLHSEVTDLGGIAPYATGWSQEVREGYEANAFFTRVVTDYVTDDSHPLSGNCARDDDDNLVPCAIVTDSAIWVGNYMPDFEGNVSQQLTLFGNFRLYAQLDWKQNFMIYNNTDQFRERQFGQGERWVRRNDPAFGQPIEETLRRFGPFYEEDGTPVSAAVVNEAYDEDGSFMRLREVSASYTVPSTLAGYVGASGATLTLGGRNLALWTNYSGADPEVGLYLADDRREEFLTLPMERAFFARLSLQF